MQDIPKCWRIYTANNVLHRIVDNARFAPSGGNRQGWRIINVSDPAKKERLAELSLLTATRYLLQMQAGASPFRIYFMPIAGAAAAREVQGIFYMGVRSRIVHGGQV